MNGDRAIRSIAVAGGGVVGLSAAIAFARALPNTDVTVIETPPDPAALADRMPTAWPGIGRFHAAVGLDEPELVRSGIASHHLGTIFDNWPGGPWVHAFGAHGKPVGAIPFDQVWARAHTARKALAYDRYAMGAALARAGKFVHPTADSNSPLSQFLYGLRLDPERYRDRLRRQAQSGKINLRPGDIGEIERRSDSSIAALKLTDGERIEADLFVDCTGPSARLLSTIDSFEDWSDWLPCDRMLIGSADGAPIPSTADRVTALELGWIGEWPLRGRTLKAVIYSGKTPEEDARRALGTADAESLTITRGRRLRPWVGNVLALGDAATAADPLHGTNLDLAQSAILLALELLPGRDFNPIETGEYNRRAEQVTRRARDFLALHYLRSGRTDGIWGKVSDREPPDSLASSLDHYGYRGRLPFHEEESVTRDSWTATLLGLGIIPRNRDPQAAEVPLDKALAAMAALAHGIGDIVAHAPTYADYLSRMTSGRGRR
jgi:tryptophan halogenase